MSDLKVKNIAIEEKATVPRVMSPRLYGKTQKLDMKVDLLSSFDFSNINKDNEEPLANTIERVINKKMKSYYRQIDVAAVKSLMYKAQKYDENCNPLLVPLHLTEKAKCDFARQLLEIIKDCNFTLADVIEYLEVYAKCAK